MGLRVELNHFGERSQQRQIRHDAELHRLQNDNRNLHTQINALQAGNNTLRIRLQAALSVISCLEQQLEFHLKSFLE